MSGSMQAAHNEESRTIATSPPMANPIIPVVLGDTLHSRCEVA